MPTLQCLTFQKLNTAYWQKRTQVAERAYGVLFGCIKELFTSRDINELEEEQCLSSSSGESTGRKEVKPRVVVEEDTDGAVTSDVSEFKQEQRMPEEAEGTESGAF